nr:uncharacterized protein LOC120826411 [Gasterosteus aculeatus aculeatus]
MACGALLRILLICLVQAERVRCLWAAKAPRQNGNMHVGFSQHSSVFGGNYPENGPEQTSGYVGSAQRGSFGADAGVGSVYSQRFPSNHYRQTSSQPAKRVYSAAGSVRSSSESKPANRPTTNLKKQNVQRTPKKANCDVSAGSSISQYDQTPNGKVTWLGQRETPRAAKHQFSLFDPSAAEPNTVPARTQTSASGAGRRASPRRGPAASRPSYFSALQDEWTRKAPGRASVNARVLPASGSGGAGNSGRVSHLTGAHDIPPQFGGFAIRHLREPADQKVGVRRPQQVHVAPQRPSSSHKPPVHRVHPAATRMRLRPPRK